MSRIETKFKQSLWILGLTAALGSPSFSLAGGKSYGGGSASGVAESEIIKRIARIEAAKEAEIQGDKLMRDGDVQGAYAKYQEALAGIPNAPLAAADRNRIVSKFIQASLSHARKLGDGGQRDEAKGILRAALAPDIAPENQDLKTLEKRLNDPDYFNPANSKKHSEKVESVDTALKMGMGYYDLGDFNAAQDQFNKALATDPYNTASRRLLEKTEHQIIAYQRAARDHTRARMIRDVDALWETAVPGTAVAPSQPKTAPVNKPNSATVFKLRNITIPSVNFEDTDIDEAINYLRDKSKELDPTQERNGVNFVVRGDMSTVPKITLTLQNLPLLEVITQVCNQAKLTYRVEPFSVSISKIGDGTGELDTRVFRVPPDFLSAAGSDEAAPDASADPFSGGGTENKPAVRRRPDAKQVLVGMGADFTAAGADAKFLPGSSSLIVKNSALQLDLIEQIIDELNQRKPKQVQVTAKFVEVSQRNTDELGFDWLMGAFNVGSSGIFGSGGTTGNSGNLRAADYPFINPTSGTQPVPTAQNPITRALRFGTNAINQNAIDGLLARQITAGDISNVTPATFAIAGVFSDPQFQTLMRALSQKKGVDLLTAPTVVAKSGQRAKIEVIREFPYPTDFDPPQIPQNFGGQGNNGGGFGGANGGGGFGGVLGGLGGGQVNSFPVTPTTPTAFDTKPTGVTMEIDPLLGEDGYTVELTLTPEVVEFEGFINYGSPINTGAVNAAGVPTTVILTENRIEQPVFATRRLNTQVTIWDGQTVGVGGLIREDVQNVEDKVPLFGDIPLVGRLFKTKAEEHFKKNLMIYVTANVIDPSGQRIRDTAQKEESAALDGADGGATTDILPPVTP